MGPRSHAAPVGDVELLDECEQFGPIQADGASADSGPATTVTATYGSGSGSDAGLGMSMRSYASSSTICSGSNPSFLTRRSISTKDGHVSALAEALLDQLQQALLVRAEYGLLSGMPASLSDEISLPRKRTVVAATLEHCDHDGRAGEPANAGHR